MVVRKRPPAEDRRTTKTRKALEAAFTALFFEKPYSRITVGDIVRRAAVGRSTFYEHFVDKEDVLAATIRRPLTVLASSVDAGLDVAAVKRVVDHFWENRNQTRSLLGGGARDPITRVLAGMIAERLGDRSSAKTVAAAIAGAQIGTLVAWLRGETGGNADETASVLHRVAQVLGE